MSVAGPASSDIWFDAVQCAALLAVSPHGIGGAALRAPAGPVRDRWLALLRALLPADAPMRRIPIHVSDGRLLGGLDLAATLQAGRPVAERGILAQSDQGLVVLAMAERTSSAMAARLAAVMDSGVVVTARDGVAMRSPALLGVVALDESAADDEMPPPALLDRLGLRLDLRAVRLAESSLAPAWEASQVAAARRRLPAVACSVAMIEVLCATADALGIASLRAPLLALQTARAAAALAGRPEITQADVILGARLVLAPRATTVPVDRQEQAAAPAQACEEDSARTDTADQPPEREARKPETRDAEQIAPQDFDQPLQETVLAAAAANVPDGLLARIRLAGGELARARSAGRAGVMQGAALRGRPAGVSRGELRAGSRLNVIATLRAAAPWQRLRRPPQGAAPPLRPPPRIHVRREDFQVSRFKQRTETTTIFAVDASGSAALHRLAEAKGAVELLLADCYVRRDRVAVLAFRGKGAQILLPPTRSLVRAKRSLASLPGGGGTPLAAGIDAAVLLAQSVARRGGTPLVVLLTDGSANVSRQGNGGRAAAAQDALLAARLLRAQGLGALLVDTSPQPQEIARRLAAEMNAGYLPLPHARAHELSAAVRAPARSRQPVS
jgi:magnesium chelatase subunit D